MMFMRHFLHLLFHLPGTLYIMVCVDSAYGATEAFGCVF